jgi:hypothetical protein
MEINLDIVLLLIISFIFGVLIGMYIKKTNGQENLINLDDSRKVELTKCCTDPKCYSKPPYLRENCIKNKNNAREQLESKFKQMYTQEEYYKKLEDLGITSKGELTNKKIDEAYYAKMNEKIVINTALDEKTEETIRKDDRDEVRGYDTNNLAAYKLN